MYSGSCSSIEHIKCKYFCLCVEYPFFVNHCFKKNPCLSEMQEPDYLFQKEADLTDLIDPKGILFVFTIMTLFSHKDITKVKINIFHFGYSDLSA